jgi:hypothetical protein
MRRTQNKGNQIFMHSRGSSIALNRRNSSPVPLQKLKKDRDPNQSSAGILMETWGTQLALKVSTSIEKLPLLSRLMKEGIPKTQAARSALVMECLRHGELEISEEILRKFTLSKLTLAGPLDARDFEILRALPVEILVKIQYLELCHLELDLCATEGLLNLIGHLSRLKHLVLDGVRSEVPCDDVVKNTSGWQALVSVHVLCREGERCSVLPPILKLTKPSHLRIEGYGILESDHKALYETLVSYQAPRTLQLIRLSEGADVYIQLLKPQESRLRELLLHKCKINSFHGIDRNWTGLRLTKFHLSDCSIVSTHDFLQFGVALAGCRTLQRFHVTPGPTELPEYNYLDIGYFQILNDLICSAKELTHLEMFGIEAPFHNPYLWDGVTDFLTVNNSLRGFKIVGPLSERNRRQIEEVVRRNRKAWALGVYVRGAMMGLCHSNGPALGFLQKVHAEYIGNQLLESSRPSTLALTLSAVNKAAYEKAKSELEKCKDQDAALSLDEETPFYKQK